MGTMRTLSAAKVPMTALAEGVVTDDEDRPAEEFLRELVANAPEGETERLPDGVRHVFQMSDDDVEEMPHRTFGYVVRRGSALLVACFYSTPGTA